METERESSLKLAIANEEAEIAFYRNHADRSTNNPAKTLFNMLAAQEEHHIELLTAMHNRDVLSERWPETVSVQVSDTDVLEALDNCLSAACASSPHDLDDIQALEKAIEFEKNAQVFYARLADDCDDPKEECFFTALSQMERDHRSWIEEFLRALVEE